ncbi:4Fe-4S binding protein [Methanolobus profundi]|uniref:4Fe-4S dicluster domain-containing protein n=1 Tax=Methanolobus profundi TaxID=487685 RepID=A0A1I4S9C2_9EURY|nr:4Fe-4S binding protein [Methanolobus profundi]SFM61078.1 4Fe-4S dicluster domain-containing protein [Methanolobus profundi]
MPLVNKSKCVSCKKCVKKCPVDAIEMVKGKAVIEEDKCINCGKCIKICPVKAILKDREVVRFLISSNMNDVKDSLSDSKNKKAKKRVIRSRMRQLKREQQVLRGMMKELKRLKL